MGLAGKVCAEVEWCTQWAGLRHIYLAGWFRGPVRQGSMLNKEQGKQKVRPASCVLPEALCHRRLQHSFCIFQHQQSCQVVKLQRCC
jgi:hypothetical protein